MTINIITLNPSEWQRYKEFRLSALREHPRIAFQTDYNEEASYPDHIWQQRLQDVQDGKAYLFFAQDKGALCGMVAGVVDQGRNASHRVNIIGLYIIPDYQTDFLIHKKLVEHLLNAIETNPLLKRVQVTVNAHSPIPSNFYKEFGFTTVGLLKKYVRLKDNEFQDRYLMEKIL